MYSYTSYSLVEKQSLLPKNYTFYDHLASNTRTLLQYMTQDVLLGHDTVNSRHAREFHNGNLMLELYLQWHRDAHLNDRLLSKVSLQSIKSDVPKKGDLQSPKE